MNQDTCRMQSLSNRTIGIFILIVSLPLGFIGGLIVPIFGFFFVTPLLVLAGVFIFAPHSSACRLIMGKVCLSQEQGSS